MKENDLKARNEESQAAVSHSCSLKKIKLHTWISR